MSDYNGDPLKFRFKEGDLERLESMYNYKSPIEMIATEMQTKYENECVSVCQRYGFNVNKEELAKALAYDRNQYDKGFKDGYNQALKEQQELRESMENEILDVIHKSIYQFIDLRYEEEPMSDKDKLLLEVNKAICNNLRWKKNEKEC